MNKKFNVEHFAKLSRLEFSEDEKNQIQDQMTNILKMIQPLLELDLDQVENTNFTTSITNVIREDVIGQSIPVEKVIQTFPKTVNNSCKVPLIIGDE